MDTIDRYFADHHIDPIRSSQADVVMGLLHLGTQEATEMLTEIMGKPITRCPPAVPPWPPKPVKRAPKERRVARVRARSPHPTSKLSQIRVGMTEKQIHEMGVSMRDIRYWTERGHVEWTPE